MIIGFDIITIGLLSELFLLYPKLFYCIKGVVYSALKVFKLVASLCGPLFYWKVVSRSKDRPLTYFVSLAFLSAGHKAVNACYFDCELNLTIKHRHSQVNRNKLLANQHRVSPKSIVCVMVQYLDLFLPE